MKKKALILVSSKEIINVFKFYFRNLFDMVFMEQSEFKISDLENHYDVIFIYDMVDEGFELFEQIDLVKNQKTLLIGSILGYPDKATERIHYWESWEQLKDWVTQKMA